MDDEAPIRRPSEYHGAGNQQAGDVDQGHRKLLETLGVDSMRRNETVAKGNMAEMQRRKAIDALITKVHGED